MIILNIINLIKSKNKRISITAYGTVNIIDDSGITGHEKVLSRLTVI